MVSNVKLSTVPKFPEVIFKSHVDAIKCTDSHADLFIFFRDTHWRPKNDKHDPRYRFLVVLFLHCL